MTTDKSLISIQEIDSYKKFIGNKTLNLKKCSDFGFNVPKFLAIPSTVTSILLTNPSARKDIAKKIVHTLPSEKYAIRSSGLLEDSQSQSFAGQFLTKTNVRPSGLEDAIRQVLEHADKYLKGQIDKFSIIIQEYINPQMAGVTFTRNPNGSREMIIEYGYCEGEKIVSGEIKPKKVSFYWSEQTPKKLPESFVDQKVIEQFKDIETKNNWPQDIEWCFKDETFYILQNRPITTISPEKYQESTFLDNNLAKQKKYYFEKTEISEIAPKPNTITLDILKKIYSPKGPVTNIYKKYNVAYKDTDFLKIVGNDLYVDKEKEIQSLLPAYSYLQNNTYSAKFRKYSKTLITLKNLLHLNKIKTDDYEYIFDNLKNKIEETTPELNIKEILEKFLTDYEIIFQANLLSGMAIKKLEAILKNEKINLPEIIESSSTFVDLDKYKINLPQNLQGNSIDIADKSEFATSVKNSQENKDTKEWWQKISSYKKKVFEKKIEEGIFYNYLREVGRYLTVKNINLLRQSLLNIAKQNNFANPEDIYFTNLENVLENKINEEKCIANKNNYLKYKDFEFPSTLTSSVPNIKNKIMGVSAGVATGILQTADMIKNTGDKNIILYTKMLSPDLTTYFDKISGIVSNNGGLLSHLAIVARESNIPVIVGVSLNTTQIKIGDKIQIDGSQGKISKIN
ncbi:hypothetical protein HON36_00985 [Candidatus Parcubacteria bacterium]|jgi:rifampicin phosphotransferase|nr:hypothetical protein [Candidatus Parcubacteria bacterium]MBT7228685.1 hypothetical protein [Candidatus Parcubacteria bacterium]